MKRYLLFLGFVLALGLPGVVQAGASLESAQGQPDLAQIAVTPTPTSIQRPAIPPIRLPLSRPAQDAAVITATVAAGVAVTATPPLTTATTPLATAPLVAVATPDPYAGALEGTIIANRTELPVRFFVEGQTYDLAPLRSLGLLLPRESAVLNLFNCASTRDSSDPACFWDPYLLKQEGFYEVIGGGEAGRPVDVALREAGNPPANQIWVQNRSGTVESIIIGDDVVELAPSGVREFVVETEGPVIIQLRECIQQGDQSVCEWTPRGVEAGYYYSLVRNEIPGPDNTQLVSIDLERVLATVAPVAAPAVAATSSGACRVLVPTLNVRSGPGLEFSIIAKVRSETEQSASITVVGFDPSREWMQVAPEVAEDGWVTTNPDYIFCSGSLAQLPIIEPPIVVVPTPTPEPTVVVAPVAVEEAPVVAEAAVTEAAPTSAASTETTPVDEAPATATTDETGATPADEAAPPAGDPIPTGQARLVVNNGMDQIMRFTMEQRFRVDTSNPSGEWDLQPGQSLTFLVYPGMIAFSVSTPWQGGLGDNADFFINQEEERALWLYFVPDPDGSGEWNLQF